MAVNPSILTVDGPDLMLVGAILLSAFSGGLIALVGVWLQRKVARKKAALDLALEFMLPEVQESEQTFLDRCKKGKWSQLQPEREKTASERRQILTYLNRFELMAVAIRQNVVHEAFLKAVIGDKLVRHYAKAKPLVDLIRTQEGDDEFFEHLEFIAKNSSPRGGGTTRWSLDSGPSVQLSEKSSESERPSSALPSQARCTR